MKETSDRSRGNRYFASKCKTMAQVVNFTKPRASHNSKKSAELRDAACVIRVRDYTLAYPAEKKVSFGKLFGSIQSLKD